jgi:hypothetical protein
MLKLSSNRIAAAGVQGLVDAIVRHPTHSLAVLDVSSNRVI